ncbi:MAG TPA: HAMP domain-containing sensor histidine kinase [Solirubrobacteraceae bacterium]|jgi:two-component system sensor histidine kinase MprB
MRIVRSLRGRLVGAAAVAVFLAVAGIAGAAAEFVTYELSSNLDTSLRERAGDVARLSASAPALLRTPGVLDSAEGGRQLDVEVLDAHGRILSRSLSLGARVLPTLAVVRRALMEGRSGYADFTIDGRRSRLYAAPLADTGGQASGGVVIVASQLGDIDSVGRRLRVGLLLFGGGAALIGALLAALLVARALRPLYRLSRGVAAIEQTASPTQRVEEPGTRDELQDLAATLNRMLGALEATHDRERRMLADASHELRTPLTSLLGNIEFLAAWGASDELIHDLRHDAARLDRLVGDLLTLERAGATSTPDKPVDLAGVVAEAVAGQDRVRSVVDSRPVVSGEAPALVRAVTNLIENGLVHGPVGGQVDVTLRQHGDLAEISVSDKGSGIPEDARERAFERFWRGEESAGRPGSGLGLAIVRAIAERHRGTVRVEGATVTITLPTTADQPPARRAPTMAAGP